MATRTISDTGGNWNDPAAWVEGVVPTWADDVVATPTSGNLSTDGISSCRSIDLTGYTGLFTKSTSQLTVYGAGDATVDVVFPSTMATTGAAYLALGPSATGTRTFNLDIQVTWSTIVVGYASNPNITVNLQRDLIAQRIVVTGGTFRTNNYALDLTQFDANNSNTKTLDFGSSLITLRYAGGNNALLILPTGTTVVPNSSIVTFTSDGSANVSGTNMNGMSLVWNSSAHLLNGGTYKNVTVIGNTSKTGFLILSGNLTITDTLNVKGNSAVNRILIYSYTLGGQKIIVAANVDFANVDFRDIRGSGTADWNLADIPGGSGDCGGNDDITFTPSQTNYWRGGTGNWSDSTKWGNLINNPSFEIFTGTQNDDISDAFAYWTVVSGYGPVEATTIAQDGESGVKITNVSGQSYIYQNFAVVPLQRYYYRFWNRGDGSGYIGRWQIWDRTNAAYIIAPANGTTNTTYTQFSGSFVAPAGCTSVHVAFFGPLHFTGPIQTAATYFDNVAISATEDGLNGRVPLPQDDVRFDANSFTAAWQTVTCDMPRIGRNIDWTGATNNPTWLLTSLANYMYGSLTFISGMIVTNNKQFYMQGRGEHTITRVGQTSLLYLYIEMIGGTLALLDALNINGYPITLNYGTLVTNGYSVVLNGFYAAAGTTIIPSSTTFSLGGGNPWRINSAATGDFSAATISFHSVYSGGIVFTGGGKTYNKLIIAGGANAGPVTITDSNTFDDITINGPRNIKLPSGTTQTVKSFTTRSASGSLISISATTADSPAMLTRQVGVVSCNYLSLQDISVTGGAMWFAGKQSEDVGGNSGWIFETYTPPAMLD